MFVTNILTKDGLTILGAPGHNARESSHLKDPEKNSEQGSRERNVNYASSLVLYMTLPDSSLGVSRLLGRLVKPGAEAVSSETESEVVRLFDEHRNRLLRYVLSIGLTVHDGEEIVQEVFLALFRHLQMGRPRDNLRGWIFRVAHNLALKERQAGHLRIDSAELNDAVADRHIDPAPSPEQQLLFSRRQEHLFAAFRALSTRDQYCLHLRAEGLRYREIAEVLDMSLGAVSISLTRSLARLERADRG
jgi:RNA polymerase sigma-70 factor (ECF subfamily)